MALQPVERGEKSMIRGALWLWPGALLAFWGGGKKNFFLFFFAFPISFQIRVLSLHQKTIESLNINP